MSLKLKDSIRIKSKCEQTNKISIGAKYDENLNLQIKKFSLYLANSIHWYTFHTQKTKLLSKLNNWNKYLIQIMDFLITKGMSMWMHIFN